MQLKDDEKEYTDKSRIQSIIKKYSNFVSFPILVCGERANQITAIWKEPKKNITEEQYNEFYKFISNTEDTPLFRLHTSAEAPIQFSSILYCPSTNYETYGFKKLEHGLQLYSNKILIQSDCKMLLPEYLRFIRGVVDSADIPLNISRETFQDNRMIQKMKSILVKQIITLLQKLDKNEKAKYETFWNQFGRILKEGVHFDFENRDLSLGSRRGSNGNTVSSQTNAAYGNNNLYRDTTITWGLNDGNLVGGIKSISVLLFTCAQFQIQFTPNIDKTSVKVLTLTFRFSWARRP